MTAFCSPPNSLQSATVYAYVGISNIAIFRFLLESYGHIGYMSVLDKYTGLIKIKTTSDLAATLRAALVEINESVAFTLISPLRG